MAKMAFTPEGVCARQIEIEADGDTIKEVIFTRGCAGNASGVAALVKGQQIDDVIERLKGIECRNNTSCPDQLAKALESLKAGSS